MFYLLLSLCIHVVWASIIWGEIRPGLMGRGKSAKHFADNTQSVLIADSEEELRRKALRESGAVVSHYSANNLVNNPDNAVLLFNNKGKADTLSWKSQGKKSP